MRNKLISTALATLAPIAMAYASKPLVNPATLFKTPTWYAAYTTASKEKEPKDFYVLKGHETKSKTVALTFDDGPHQGYTQNLVKILEDKKAPATFFVIGKQVERNPDLVRDEVAGGFTVGNHSYSHVTLTKVSEADQMTEFFACNEAVEKAAGITPTYCRPPGGDTNSSVERAAAANGLTTVLWSDDPGDYASPGQKEILDSTLDHLSDGGIILLHDGTQQTVDILPKLIDEIRAKGYKIVPISEIQKTKV